MINRAGLLQSGEKEVSEVIGPVGKPITMLTNSY